MWVMLSGDNGTKGLGDNVRTYLKKVIIFMFLSC